MKLSWNTPEDRKKLRRAAILAVPMHGQVKLSSEGYRTRDGHLIEWFGRLNHEVGPVGVVSRPDPYVFHLLSKQKRATVAANTLDISTPTIRILKFESAGCGGLILPQITPAIYLL